LIIIVITWKLTLKNQSKSDQYNRSCFSKKNEQINAVCSFQLLENLCHKSLIEF